MYKIEDTLLAETISKLETLLRKRKLDLYLNNTKPGFMPKVVAEEIKKDIKDTEELIKKLEELRDGFKYYEN